MHRIYSARLQIFIFIVLINALLIISTVLFTQAPTNCYSAGYTHEILGDWDTTVACSGFERMVEGLFYVFTFPFWFMWPVTIGVIFSPVINVISRRKLNAATFTTSLFLVTALYAFVIAAQIFFLVAT